VSARLTVVSSHGLARVCTYARTQPMRRMNGTSAERAGRHGATEGR
jgi:hypothetical protein